MGRIGEPPLTWGQQSAGASSEDNTGQNTSKGNKHWKQIPYIPCNKSQIDKNPAGDPGIEPGTSWPAGNDGIEAELVL